MRVLFGVATCFATCNAHELVWIVWCQTSWTLSARPPQLAEQQPDIASERVCASCISFLGGNTDANAIITPMRILSPTMGCSVHIHTYMCETFVRIQNVESLRKCVFSVAYALRSNEMKDECVRVQPMWDWWLFLTQKDVQGERTM